MIPSQPSREESCLRSTGGPKPLIAHACHAREASVSVLPVLPAGIPEHHELWKGLVGGRRRQGLHASAQGIRNTVMVPA